MFHFSFVTAAAILTLLFSFALGWASYRYYLLEANLATFHQREQVGIKRAGKLVQSLITVSTHYPLLLSEVKASLEVLEANKTEIENGLSSNGITVPPESLDLTLIHQILERSLPTISTRDTAVVIYILKRYLRVTLDQSNLILDPSYQGYYLVDSICSSLPDILFGRMSWSEASQRLIKGDDDVAEQEIGAHLASFEYYRTSIDKALRINGRLIDEDILRDLAVLHQTNGEFEKTINGLLVRLGDGATVQPKEFKTLHDLIDQVEARARETAEAGVRLFSAVNRNRIKNSHFESMVSLGVSLFLWLASVAFTAVVIQAVMHSEATMQAQILNQKAALMKSQRLAALGEVSSGIGHEIANPLMVIKGTANLLDEQYRDDAGIHRYALRIRKMVDRIDSIIRSMRMFLQSNDEGWEGVAVDLNLVLTESEQQLEYKIERGDVVVKFNNLTACPLLVWGNEEELIQVFSNLLSNAIDAVKDSVTKLIEITIQPNGDVVHVVVQDSGCGIKAADRERIFEALFSTKSLSEGTGLGLPIAQKILSKYRGQVRLTNSSYGARFEVTLSLYSNPGRFAFEPRSLRT
jgi:signal transduction histidine kinase